MNNANDAIVSILRTARGCRPYSLSDMETEQCLNITLALAVELIASNDRIDRLERQLARVSGKPLDEIRFGGSEETAEAERQSANESTLTRVLRILIDPREAVDQRPRFRRQE